ncbi:MAG: sodium:solute symporter family protein [Sandaracinus sp.]|nr:sodium:solute symporter family protein [Sandaracinus sp.]
MDRLHVAWMAFGVYLAVTTWLAWRGMKKTTSLSGFALGNGDMGPLLVGITLAASIASTATFVINPGFVWKDGLAAFVHFGIAGFGGVTVGLVVLSKGFRALGAKTKALTLPHWIGARFESPGLRTYFALLNLVLAIAFVVLIIKGSAIVMQLTLGLSYFWSVVLIVGFVFSYILMGGTYAHAYTNALQGAMMVIVAVALVYSGLHLFGGETSFLERLAERGPNLVEVPNPDSPLFNNVFDVFIAGFVVSFGLVCQPHILTKALYLRSDRDLRRYLVIATLIGATFAGILIVGLYARVGFPELDTVPQDAVVASYLGKAFSPIVGVLVSVALLAAGMSTMDGILVSASTIAGSDLFLGALGQKLFPNLDQEARETMALKASRWILVAMGVGAFLLALDPPQLVGLFAQFGIYGLVAASVGPVVYGIFAQRATASGAIAAAVAGPLVHFGHQIAVGFTLNPARTATEGVLVAVVLQGVFLMVSSRDRAAKAAGSLIA